jgi:hypothetical protein
MANQLAKRLAKLEQDMSGPSDWENIYFELFARWMCAESIPGETAEESASCHWIECKTGPAKYYERPMPENDDVLLHVAFEHARFWNETEALTAEDWKNDRIAAFTTRMDAFQAMIGIYAHQGEKNLARKPAITAHN